ncbi:MAG: DUF192 domain-containing protein [Candidatus Sericytochromatia bacterium]|nr:DUF192 domain-containing protein [Candidatus Sericytochromatia bacterium]
MKYLKITNKTNQKILGHNIGNANNTLSRLVGLIGKKKLNDGEGLLLTPCNSIHMMFMKISLDVIFLDRKNKVIHLIKNIQPWKVSKIIFKAQSVLELPVGTISRAELKIDDFLEIEKK